jgi:hypothetical protein
MGPILLLSITLEGDRIHVPTFAIGLDQSQTLWIDKVISSNEFPVRVEQLELGIRHGERQAPYHGAEQIFEIGVGDAGPGDALKHKGSDYADAIATRASDSGDETPHLPCREQLSS